ncbi:uncharacterized protein LOC134254145 [Saccostrea cucullata]|uniref:uncharacterized protein LOC134254145 n=1 Tax=Saccostrea cuccullata TaxID=36930 RepID=UPI002ED4C27F
MLLDAMYEQDQKSAMATLDETVTVFGVKTTPLTFAYENMMYDVLGHPCSQHRMDLIWHKKVEGDVVKGRCCPALCSIFDLSPKNFYFINYVMFLGVLLLYTYFVLVSADYSYLMTYKGLEPVEYTVYLWGLGDFIEEYRPLVEKDPGGRESKGYFKRAGEASGVMVKDSMGKNSNHLAISPQRS